jgi:hypothetical protein
MSDRPTETEPSQLLGTAPHPSTKVSGWWRVTTIILVVLLTVLGLSVVVLEHSASTTMTKVDWFSYEVTAGPGIDTNVTTIRGMCAPSDAITAGIFSMDWSTSTGKAVQQVRLWTLYPPDPSHPLGTPVVLYEATNASTGGTSFVSSYPNPCSLPWNLNVASNQTATVTAIATLTYNYTASNTIL